MANPRTRRKRCQVCGGVLPRRNRPRHPLCERVRRLEKEQDELILYKEGNTVYGFRLTLRS